VALRVINAVEGHPQTRLAAVVTPARDERFDLIFCQVSRPAAQLIRTARLAQNETRDVYSRRAHL
jgi:hypothetical protein